MAAGVPPPPLNSPSGSYYWLEWYTNLTNFLNGTNIPWANINFGGSDISDIQNRSHNSLTNIQGGNASESRNPTGNAYHLMGYGFSNTSAGSTQVPGGWTVTHSATGVYTITHNLGLTAPNYMAGATAHTAGCIVTFVALTTGNVITVHTAGTAALGTAQDSDISFWVGTL